MGDSSDDALEWLTVDHEKTEEFPRSKRSPENATKFNLSDLDDVSGQRRAFWKRLQKHNRDIHSGRGDVEIPSDVDRKYKVYTMRAFGHQLNMTDKQITRAVNHLLRLDLAKAGLRLEVVAFCICAKILNEDIEAYSEDTEKVYYPTRDAANNDDLLQNLAEDIQDSFGDVDEGRLTSVYPKVSQDHLPTKDDYERWQSADDTP